MRFTLFALASLITVGVQAHFNLTFPAPRGKFDEDNEPKFCDGYTNIGSASRIPFPLTNGVIELDSEHPTWTFAVEVATGANPNSFDNFTNKYVVSPLKGAGEGNFCIGPIDFTTAGLTDGANATILLIFDGGDGTLYQCADLTLSSTVDISGKTSSDCTQVKVVTNSTSTSAPTGTGASTTGAASPTTTAAKGNGAKTTEQSAMVLFTLVGIAVSFALFN